MSDTSTTEELLPAECFTLQTDGTVVACPWTSTTVIVDVGTPPLPKTGVDVPTFVGVAVALVLFGASLLVRVRR